LSVHTYSLAFALCCSTMQPYTLRVVALVLCTLLFESEARSLVSRSLNDQALRLGSSGSSTAGVITSSSYGAELVQLRAVDAEDRRFWSHMWDAVSGELRHLQTAAAGGVGDLSGGNGNHGRHFSSLAQLSNGSHAVGEERRHSLLRGIHVNLNPKAPADLIPALAMLKGMYEDGKQRIAELNAHEKKYKQSFAERQAKHDSKMADIARQKLSDDFKANETKDENRLFNYWQRVRERQHRQFHTSLKIQHGTLQKVKTMIDMYEKAIAGKDDRAQAKEQLARVAGGAVPEVVLLQEAWQATAQYCNEALAEAHSAESDIAEITDAAGGTAAAKVAKPARHMQ